jgi:hypothetical protein
MNALELIEDIPAPSNVAALPLANATPADLLRIAVQNNADLDRLERLMTLQVQWEAREAEKAFRRDFAAFRGENIIIPKTKHVDRGRAGSFVQAEYDQVCQRLSPALSKHGFSFRHDQRFGARPWTTDGVVSDAAWVYVICFLEHKDGHVEKLELEGPPGDLSANTPVQNMQSTASYLKRQSVLAITGTATGGEDDESRMGGKPASEDGGVNPLLQAGRDASMQGMAALTKWWGSLTARQRTDLNEDFRAMRRAAQQADEGGAR